MANNIKSMSYKIPNETNKFYVSNGADFIPNIQYTKNIDLDEEGYLKLSPPFPKLTSSADIADFGILADVLEYSDGSGWGDAIFKVVTDDKIYDVNLVDFTVTLDALAPGGDMEARFSGWKGGTYDKRAYIGTDSDIWAFEASYGYSPGTQRWKKENIDSIEYNETFINRNTLVGATGSNVQQYTEADMNDTTPPSTNSGQTLTLPSSFEVTGMAYSNYRMGIATYNKTIGSAFLFVWDGATADASQGFPVNAKMIIDIIAYRNSWVVLTSAGQLLLFNGGGFDVLGNLPFYFTSAEWLGIESQSIAHGKIMRADGDVIYFNIGTQLLSNDDDSGLMKGFYAGVWCYDPDVDGIYHRYGLSHSQIIIDSSNATAGVFTHVGHLLETGDKVRYTLNKIYFAIKLTADTFKLANSYDLALLGTATSDNCDSDKIWIKRTDWSQIGANNGNFGAIAKFQNGQAMVQSGTRAFFAGLGMYSKTLTYSNITSIMCPVLDNIGSVCYSKIKAVGFEDTWNSVSVKYKKLTENDKIVVKYKLIDSYKQIAVGEADDSTPDRYISWVNANSFTTTKDLTEVSVGDEVEFYQGAGAGSTAHITTLTNNSGTWTVELDENIRGAESGNRSTCIFDSFKKAGVITKDTENNYTNQARFPIDLASKWIQVKLELRGNNIMVEETIINNAKASPIS